LATLATLSRLAALTWLTALSRLTPGLAATLATRLSAVASLAGLVAARTGGAAATETAHGSARRSSTAADARHRRGLACVLVLEEFAVRVDRLRRADDAPDEEPDPDQPDNDERNQVRDEGRHDGRLGRERTENLRDPEQAHDDEHQCRNRQPDHRAFEVTEHSHVGPTVSQELQWFGS
jgi:hypothetical protein